MTKREKTFIVLYGTSMLTIAAGVILFFVIDFFRKEFICNLIVSVGVCIITGCLVANLISDAEKKDNKNAQIKVVESVTTLVMYSVLKITYTLMEITDSTFDTDSSTDIFGKRFYKFCEDFPAINRLLTKKKKNETFVYLNKSGKNLKIILTEYAECIQKSRFHPIVLQVIDKLNDMITKTKLNPKIKLLKEIVEKLEKIDSISTQFDQPTIVTKDLIKTFVD